MDVHGVADEQGCVYISDEILSGVPTAGERWSMPTQLLLLESLDANSIVDELVMQLNTLLTPAAGERWGVLTQSLLLQCLDVQGVADELGSADAEAEPYDTDSK